MFKWFPTIPSFERRSHSATVALLPAVISSVRSCPNPPDNPTSVAKTSSPAATCTLHGRFCLCLCDSAVRLCGWVGCGRARTHLLQTLASSTHVTASSSPASSCHLLPREHAHTPASHPLRQHKPFRVTHTRPYPSLASAIKPLPFVAAFRGLKPAADVITVSPGGTPCRRFTVPYGTPDLVLNAGSNRRPRSSASASSSSRYHAYSAIRRTSVPRRPPRYASGRAQIRHVTDTCCRSCCCPPGAPSLSPLVSFPLPRSPPFPPSTSPPFTAVPRARSPGA